MARHAIDRAPKPWPTPRTADYPPPTRKIRKARAEGQVARSRDLSHFAAIGSGAALLAVAAPEALAWLQTTLAAALRFDARALAEPQVMQQRLALLSLPARADGAGHRRWSCWWWRWSAGVLSGGWNFSLQAAAAQVRASSTRFAGLGAHVLRPAAGRHAEGLPAGADPGQRSARCYLKRNLPRFAEAAGHAAAGGAGACRQRWCSAACCCWCWRWRCLRWSTCRCSATSWRSTLKMSVQEVKQEHKEVEGNAEVKAQHALAHARAGQPPHAGRRARAPTWW